ncbi:MAG: PAS domain-containing protein [Steroidobacteraceae bacterium]
MNVQSSPAILIVEDERIVAKDLQRTLADMGYDAFAIAASAEEAVACASAKCPDIVLVDIRIKGQEDGIHTAEILRSKFQASVIFLTAHADEATLDRAKRTEPQGYLVKPVKDAELRSMIEISRYKQQLERAREHLRASQQRLGIIADNVPISIGYFDREGRVQFANRLFCDLVPDRHDGLGVAAKAFLGDSLYKESYRPRQRALAGEHVRFVANLRRNGASEQHEMTYLPDRDSSGSVVGVYALGYDVTERERMNAELQQARVDLETILNNVPASITSWRADLMNRFANRTAETQFGIPPGRTPGMHARRAMGAERYRNAQAAIETALKGERCSHESAERNSAELVRCTHDDYVPEIKEGAVVGLYALSVDITDLRRSHEKICNLTRRLESVREEERRAVAVTLHDGIAQDLFAMKLGLNHLETLAKRRAGIRKICKELIQAVTKCMEDTRQVANELRPVALAYSRVSTVITDHAQHFGERSSLRVTVTETAQFPELGESVQLLLFRAAQEALTNVARHAQATAVEIALRADDGRITMEIADDGIGIAESAMSKAHSLGLLGLRERFAALGGGLAAERREPCGTTLTVYLPMPLDTPSHAV